VSLYYLPYILIRVPPFPCFMESFGSLWNHFSTHENDKKSLIFQ